MVFTIIFGGLEIQACVSQQYGSWKGIETWKYNAGLLCDTSHRLAVQRELHVEYFSGVFCMCTYVIKDPDSDSYKTTCLN